MELDRSGNRIKDDGIVNMMSSHTSMECRGSDSVHQHRQRNRQSTQDTSAEINRPSVGGESKRCGFSTRNTKLFWSHSVRLLEQLNAQRNFETFCDVVVHVGNNASFSAHRCILAASSAKLYTLMFATSHDCTRNVHLDGISVSGFKIVLEFIYTGILSFDADTITDVITAATFLEMPAVVRICEEFVSGRGAVDDNDIKLQENSSLQFKSTPVAQPEAGGSHSRASSGRFEHGSAAAVTSAWPGRFMPAADSVEDYFSMFETSFDQYFSSCKERGINIPVPNCDRVNDTVQQQSRSLSHNQCVADSLHRHHVSQDGSVS